MTWKWDFLSICRLSGSHRERWKISHGMSRVKSFLAKFLGQEVLGNNLDVVQAATSFLPHIGKDVNEKHRAYIRWKEDYKKYMQNKKKVPQQINSSNDYNKDTCKPRRSPRLAPNSAYDQTSDPFDSLFYRPLSSHNRYNVFSEDPGNSWHSKYYAPSNTFFNFF